ncbi:VWA-like domain-containing protein [Fibrobacter sp. UWB10]|uniref:VWA-like domain-containing protein n=1 Tax=Fibrobacter sp. UWB10 TaxID=1896201 RepID=UPI002402DCF4|nr:VWA-like domain-containing protein [Fibrobacter sp. UWB10]SMP51470.1 Predicted metal-dependent peptidase [Fibrobacter sp. UWB10]
MTAIERIKKISEEWFLTEPLLFVAYCSHELCENSEISVPMRTGNRKIEFSPQILDKTSDEMLEEYLKIEIFRILLKHPYQRQPPFAQKALLAMASNVTIADVYEVPKVIKDQMSGTEYSLPTGLCFEEYYCLLKENPSTKTNGANFGDHAEKKQSQSENSEYEINSNEKGNGKVECGSNENLQNIHNAQIAGLWEEDDESCCAINDLIEVALANNTWGTVPGQMQSLIKVSLKVDMDYRKMLSTFKTSVISSKRYLTRMRPNRRFGFNAMGNRYKLATNLLIAIDVSGSVTDRSISFFLSVLNRFFKYGVEKVDVLQFDANIQGDIKPFKKACKAIEVVGRGGTSFQPAADYYCAHPEYDGLIFFTDGYAKLPVYKTKRPIDVLWVLCSKNAYKDNCGWIRKLKRNRVTYIPRNE